MSALKTPTTASLPKPKITKYLLWSEQSLRARKTRDKGAQLTQIERLQVILPEEQNFSFHDRAIYTGTNRGDTIYPVKAPSWTELWMISSPKF